MSNDYNDKSWTERTNWILTVIALALVAILSIGLLCALFIQPRDNDEEAVPKDGAIISETAENGISLMSAKIMPVAYAESGVSALADTAYTLTATVEPDYSGEKEFDWEVSFQNASSSWANGKTVTNYVTVTPTSDGANTATVECKQAFGEKIIVTCTSRDYAGLSATCTVDYQQRLVVNSLKFGNVELSTETCNFKVDLFERYYADLDFSYSEGSLAYLGEGSDGYDEFVCGGIAFTDEFIAAYNSLNGSATDLTRKMNRGNLSSSVQSAKEFDFDTGAAGQGVFDDLLGSVGLTDTTIGYLRAAVNQVGEENVFKFGIFKSTSAISDAYVECDTWYKIGFNADSLFSETNSISVNQSGVVF